MRPLAVATALALAVGSLTALPAATAAPDIAAVQVAAVAPAAAPAAVQGGIVAKYQTKVATALYSTAGGSTKLATVPADYTVATRTAKKSSDGKRLQVEYKSKTGWITASKVSKVPLSTTLGKLSWKASAAKNIAAWCSRVPLSVGAGYRNEASARVATSGGKRTVTERITLSTKTGWGTSLDPNHALAVSIQYHECGHILQYRAYNYDFAALKRAMDKAYGTAGNKAGGIEHMADCIAVALGAKRKGTESLGNGATRTWTAGYGGKCTSTHLAQARKIIAGKKV